MFRNWFAITLSTGALLLMADDRKPVIAAAGGTAAPNGILLWKDPGNVRALDFSAGPGVDGAPVAPLVFQEEEAGGTSAKILVTDSAKRVWNVKWGEEVKPETFASRLVWALGYFVQPTYFVPRGNIQSVGHLTRAEMNIDRPNNNAFHNARFVLRDPRVRPVVGRNWTFADPGLTSSPQFSGLKILMMLLSNWDVKDARSSDGPNTAVIEVQREDGSPERWYAVTDWGATMGRWGGIASRSKWDCSGFEKESKDFVKGVDKNGMVGFGFKGKRQEDISADIPIAHVRWLMGYLGQITDEQLKGGLSASGADAKESACYVRALRSRIGQLQKIAAQ